MINIIIIYVYTVYIWAISVDQQGLQLANRLLIQIVKSKIECF
jgi:hypothetical protein